MKAMTLWGDTLYVGGDFTEANGRPQPGFVQFAATG